MSLLVIILKARGQFPCMDNRKWKNLHCWVYVCVLYNKKKKLCFNRAEEKGGLQGQICKAPSPPPILPAAYKELSLGVGGISRSGLIFAIQDLRL